MSIVVKWRENGDYLKSIEGGRLSIAEWTADKGKAIRFASAKEARSFIGHMNWPWARTQLVRLVPKRRSPPTALGACPTCGRT